MSWRAGKEAVGVKDEAAGETRSWTRRRVLALVRVDLKDGSEVRVEVGEGMGDGKVSGWWWGEWPDHRRGEAEGRNGVWEAGKVGVMRAGVQQHR